MIIRQAAALIKYVSATMSTAPCTTSSAADAACRDTNGAMWLKLLAMGSILVCGIAGISIPLAGGRHRLLRTESGVFFSAKAFAAGVILATGFVHMLPNGQKALSDPCLRKSGKPWDDFPVAGFVVMIASLGTLVFDFVATQFYERKHHQELSVAKPPPDGFTASAASTSTNASKEKIRILADVPAITALAEVDLALQTGGKGKDLMQIDHMHAHAALLPHSYDQGECDVHAHTHSRSHSDEHHDSDAEKESICSCGRSFSPSAGSARHAVISQILEFGIVSHSVIIGLSLGVSRSPCIIRPLLGALSFHQFFEGLALGGCISEARLGPPVTGTMACFFAVTTPAGVAIGAALAEWSYDPRSPRALVVEGVFDCVSAGILIYMALVDLIAADFLGRRMQCGKQISACLALFVGAASMSALAVWV